MGQKVFTVLAIDGGGIRGIVPARLLQEIEEKTGKPIAECFDLIGGTSTGAILASGVTAPDPKEPKKPKFKAKDLLEFYFKKGPSIFPQKKLRVLQNLVTGGGYYESEPLEEALEDRFKDAKVKDALTPLVIPASDVKNNEPQWITSDKDDDKRNLTFKDALRAATAAPTYFKTKYIYCNHNEKQPKARERFAFVDGGLFAGIISRALYTKAKKMAPKDAKIVVVFLGTGHVKFNYTPEEWNELGPLGMVSKSQSAPLVNMNLDMTVRATNNDLKEEIGEDFFEFDKEIDSENPNEPHPKHGMDEADEENLEELKRFAECIIENNSDEIEALCEILRNKKGKLPYTNDNTQNTIEKNGKTRRIWEKIKETSREICDIAIERKHKIANDNQQPKRKKKFNIFKR